MAYCSDRPRRARRRRRRWTAERPCPTRTPSGGTAHAAGFRRLARWVRRRVRIDFGFWIAFFLDFGLSARKSDKQTVSIMGGFANRMAESNTKIIEEKKETKREKKLNICMKTNKTMRY